MSNTILPGATLGILGSGQLGRMFAIAARRMGYRVHTFSPDQETPTGQVADKEVCAPYEDLDALAAFCRDVDVISFEFENVPSSASARAAQFVPVRPHGEALHVIQNRLREKTFISTHGFPHAPFRAVRSRAELDAALNELGTPAVLKTAGFGYDGKGQAVIRDATEADAAWQAIGAVEAVLEGFIDFQGEVSVVAARGLDGSFAHYGVIENLHHNHILDVSIPEAPLSPRLATEAVEIARGLMEQLEVVGVLCVEFFLTRDERLLVNELAPRPHNSGHFTFDACLTSQFEQQVRAICGLPLGSTELLRPAAMTNLLGDLWTDGEPNWAAALADPQVKLHLYGKAEARPGRKMGHITAFGSNRDDARRRAVAAREALLRR